MTTTTDEKKSAILNEAGITEETVKVYLDNLRKSGIVNMFGAAGYLVQRFGFSKTEARAELARWMENF